jgi:hypothetical protein
MNNYLLTARVKQGNDEILTYFWFEYENEMNEFINDKRKGVKEVFDKIHIINSEVVISPIRNQV